MAKRDALRLSAFQGIETGRDMNGRYFIAYSDGASVFVRNVAELRRFLRIPKGLPMRESLESWLSSLLDMDAQRDAQLSREEAGASLDAEVMATGFGPECHDGDVDNDNTRTIV